MAHRHRFFVDVEYWAGSHSLQHLLKCLDQVDHVSGKFGLGAFRLHEFLQRRIGQHCVFDLLLLQEHLRRRLILLMLQQAVDQFVSRIFLFFRRSIGVARQQHL